MTVEIPDQYTVRLSAESERSEVFFYGEAVGSLPAWRVVKLAHSTAPRQTPRA